MFEGVIVMKDNEFPVVSLRFPSISGYGELAIRLSEAITEEMGFEKNKADKFKIALREACNNAIEHGNKLDKNKEVHVSFLIKEDSLEVDVSDEGEGFDPSTLEPPDIKKKRSGDQTKRGWGVHVMKGLVDEFKLINKGNGTLLKLVVIRQGIVEKEAKNG